MLQHARIFRCWKFFNVGSPTGKTGYVQENDINVDLNRMGGHGLVNLAEDRGM